LNTVWETKAEAGKNQSTVSSNAGRNHGFTPCREIDGGVHFMADNPQTEPAPGLSTFGSSRNLLARAQLKSAHHNLHMKKSRAK
jgi:hypothetical protein